MIRIMLLTHFFCMLFSITANANKIDYGSCKSIQEVIAKETQEIFTIHPADHDELAELYVSRGESYLLDSQYEKAIEDFEPIQIKF